MKEYEIYLPLSFNDGSSVPDELVRKIKQELVEYFGGLTDFRHRNSGVWKMGPVTYHDEILILRVLSEESASARAFLEGLKASLKERLGQAEVLVVERSVQVV